MQPDSYTAIEDWLEAIDVNVLSAAATTSDIALQVNDGDLPPLTPLRLPKPTEVVEETSPTDTSFSATTIFDTPVHEPPHVNHEPSSDCDLLDAFSDNTTVYNDYDKKAVTEEQDESDSATISDAATAAPEAITPSEAITLSTDINEVSSPPPDTATTSSRVYEKEERVRIVSVTSCLQCIHLHLPCSRTYPYCMRCARNGHAALCLLHRRRFASEFGRGGGPVLLKVKGEEEEVWKMKVQVKEAMDEKWAAEQEKKNWVMPSMLGERGGWQKRGVWVDEGEGYPGEGEGRVVLREMVVEMKE